VVYVVRHYLPDTPPPDRPLTADRTPLLRPWRSNSPASMDLVEQVAMLWIDDDRREYDRLVPDAWCCEIDLVDEDLDD
jgi:hypothetical protein